MGKFSQILEYVQEVPPDHRPIKDKRQDHLTDFIFVLAIFGVAFWFRYVVYDWFFENFVDQFYLVVSKSNWLTDLLGWEEGKSYPTEGYSDLKAYYYPYVENYVDGWNPYSGSRVPGDNIAGYVYGPFYIFFISMGTMFWNLSAHDSVMVSNLTFDSLTAVMIYILAKRSTGNINAFMIANVYSFSPVVLYYFNIKLLNTPHMTFFTLVFIWCYLEHHDTSAMFFIAFGAMIKQFPLLYAMPVLMLYVRRYGWIKAIKFMFLLFFFFLLMSFPYIVMTPDGFISKYLVGGRAKTELLTLEEAREPSRAGSTPNLVFGAYFTPEDTVLDEVMFYLVNNHILFIVSLFIISWLGFSAYRLMEVRPVLYLRFFAAYQFIAHATIARGIFKYYDAYLMSLLLLAFVPDRRPNSLNIQVGSLIKRAFHTILSPKYRAKDVSWQYWLVFGLTISSTIGLFFMCYWALSMFLEQSNIRFFWTILAFFAFIFLIIKSPKKSFWEEDPTAVLSDEQSREVFVKYTSKISGKKYGDSQRESYPIYVIHIIAGFIAIGIVIYTFTSIYSFFYDTADQLLGSLPIIFFGVFFIFNGILSIKKDKWDNLEYVVFIIVFTLLRIFVFRPELYAIYTIFDLPASTVLSTIVCVGYSFAVTYLILLLKKASSTSQKLQATIQEDFSEYLVLQSKFNIQVKTYFDYLVLFSFIFSMLFVLDRAIVLFFSSTPEKYPEFVISFVLTLNAIWFLNIALYWFRSEKKKFIVSFDTYTFLLDIIYILVGFMVFFRINVMIINIDRLLGPTLIFAVGIFLFGMMGYDFWNAAIQFPVRILKVMKQIIYSRKTVRTLPSEN